MCPRVECIPIKGLAGYDHCTKKKETINLVMLSVYSVKIKDVNHTEMCFFIK